MTSLSSLQNSMLFEGGADKKSAASENESVYNDDPPQKGGDQYKTPKRRIYYADWTRAFSI